MTDYLKIGVISSTHGIKGEVKVYPTTDDVKRFKKLKNVFLDTGKEKKIVNVESVKFFKQMVIIKFKEFNSINEIEEYKGKALWVDREHAVELEEDEYFITDLIGLDVWDENNELVGKITDVLQTAANDVYEITGADNKSFLLPAIKECVLKVDINDTKTVTVHIPEGLID